MAEESIKVKRKPYRENTLKTLQQSEFARNSDWCFLFDYLYHSAGISVPRDLRQAIYKSGINLHTALRERQKVQAEGKLLPTNPSVLEKRRKLSVEYSEAYVKN